MPAYRACSGAAAAATTALGGGQGFARAGVLILQQGERRGHTALCEEDGPAQELAAPEVAAKGPFDFIFANILAGPLVDFAPAIAKALTAPGRVMLAGLMSEQEEAVTAAYEAQGMRRINRLDHEIWPVLLFVKTSHGAA